MLHIPIPTRDDAPLHVQVAGTDCPAVTTANPV
jgi:hypothetical protein